MSMQSVLLYWILTRSLLSLDHLARVPINTYCIPLQSSSIPITLTLLMSSVDHLTQNTTTHCIPFQFSSILTATCPGSSGSCAIQSRLSYLEWPSVSSDSLKLGVPLNALTPDLAQTLWHFTVWEEHGLGWRGDHFGVVPNWNRLVGGMKDWRDFAWQGLKNLSLFSVLAGDLNSRVVDRPPLVCSLCLWLYM